MDSVDLTNILTYLLPVVLIGNLLTLLYFVILHPKKNKQGNSIDVANSFDVQFKNNEQNAKEFLSTGNDIVLSELNKAFMESEI